MNIGIDARWIFRETSGIGAYTAALIKALVRGGHQHRFTLFFHDPVCRDRVMNETAVAAAGTQRVMAWMLPFGLFSPWGQARLPGLLRQAGIDVFHSTNYLIPLPAFPRHRRGRIKAVVTVHDVIPLLFPHAAPKSVKSRFFFVYRHLMIEIGRRAHAVISDSEASRRDVVRKMNIPVSRHGDVVAIPCGVDTELFAPAPQPAGDGGPASGNAGERTVLYVGRADPYKNLAGLLRALGAAGPGLPFAVKLRIAGPPDARYPQALLTARELGMEKQVEWTGYLTDAQLVEAYRTADLLVLPSYYEGFGLPVVEAMACGTPVVCSNRGSLPEVAGDAALVVDPDLPGALADALVRGLTDDDLRTRLRQAGLRRAREYSWDRTARQTMQVYERVYDAGSRAGEGREPAL